MVRLANQLLKYRIQLKLEGGKRVRRIGLCISGQSIAGLHRRIKECQPGGLNDKIICMIGTNSIRRGLTHACCRKRLGDLVDELFEKGVKDLILCTIPPLPVHYHDTAIWKNLFGYNREIRKFAKRPNIRVCNVFINFYFPDRRIDIEPNVDFSCFEPTYGGTSKVDLIHLNRKGLSKMRDSLRLVLDGEHIRIS